MPTRSPLLISLTQTVAIVTLAWVFLGVRSAIAQQPESSLPKVIHSDPIVYPPLARQVRVQGDVHMRVSTDGNHVRNVTVISGPALLIPVATTYVLSWQFEPHEPLSFEAVLHFSFPELNCSPDAGTTTLIHPSEVKIVAPSFLPCRPIPNPTKPLFVNLFVNLNGKIISPPSEISLRVGDRSIHLPVENGEIAIPPPFWVKEDANVDVSLFVKGELIKFSILSVFFGDERWTILLADRRFPEGYSWSRKDGRVRSGCLIVFESRYGDAGIVHRAASCRSKLKW